ncbi:MAG: hypothetical protein QOH58_3576 [Thermoleophilaceae bacterium]|nr:hypothetical protein [Thermoleophilaceae bacterium]
MKRPVTALVVAAALAAVPAGVALAGGSGSSAQPSGTEAQSGPDATSVQSARPDRDHGDRKDCPRKGQDNRDSTQL